MPLSWRRMEKGGEARRGRTKQFASSVFQMQHCQLEAKWLSILPLLLITNVCNGQNDLLICCSSISVLTYLQLLLVACKRFSSFLKKWHYQLVAFEMACVFNSFHWSNAFWNFLFVDPFWLWKITMDPHILAHINVECPDFRYPKLKICISDLILGSYEYMPVACVIVHYMV